MRRDGGSKSLLKLTAFRLSGQGTADAIRRLGHGYEPMILSGGYGPLEPTDDESTGLPLLRLPPGFRYASYGWYRDVMDGGIATPPGHDGMGIVDEWGGIVTLCRNHRLTASQLAFGPASITYDVKATGGCTILQFDTRRGEWIRSRPSLSGTTRNRAGGRTPWGSWLSCEGTVAAPGDSIDGRILNLRKTHGWVFEVPKAGDADAVPLKEMGRMVHESLAVDPDTGIVYQTEDHRTAGFYRFMPEQPECLAKGGTLQMLKVRGEETMLAPKTHGKTYQCEWTTIDDPEQAHTKDTNDRLGCHSQGVHKGATPFPRLEGCWIDEGQVYFGAIFGGHTKASQIWKYDPRREQLKLLSVSKPTARIESNPTPAGNTDSGVLFCDEGGGVDRRLHGLASDGSLYSLASNNIRLRGERNRIKGDFRSAGWAGATFSQDGEWLFVNLRKPGITFAITGPWNTGA